MQISNSYKVFVGLIIAIAAANILIMNDYTSVLDKGEAFSLFMVDNGSFAWSNLIPQGIFSLADDPGKLNLFWLRLCSVFFTVGALGVFYFFGRKLFGQSTMLTFIVVAISNLLIINLSKFATSDAFVGAFHLLSLLFFLLSIKQSILKWQILFWICTFLAGMAAPFPTLIFSLFLLIGFGRFHPQKKQLPNIWITGVLLLIPIIFIISDNVLRFQENYFWLPTDRLDVFKFIGFLFLGMLPWIGFVPGALYDMFKKLRKGEELAIITTVWLIGGIAADSLVASYALCFIVAKHVMAYRAKYYPYDNSVKTFSLLTIVIFFVVATVTMIGGFYEFAAVGFRSAMAICAVSWIFGFLAILGMFMKDARFVEGGMALNGVLVTFLFWIQVNPFLELHRSVPSSIVKQANELSFGQDHRLYIPATFADSENRETNYRLLTRKQPNVKEVFFYDDASKIDVKGSAIVLADSASYNQILPLKTKDPDSLLIRRSFLADEETVWLIPVSGQ